MPESAEIYPKMSDIVSMAEYAWNITCLNKPGI